METITTRWHQRLGHLNIRDLLDSTSKGRILGTNSLTQPPNWKCETCIKGKMSQLPFPNKSERKSELLELIHTDICGPMRVDSYGGAKYFITFIDDHSRWCEIHMLKRKSEAFEAFKKFKNSVENVTSRKIKYLQSDNATEFLSQEFENYLQEHGIQRRLSAPYTPQQNGVAERKN